MAIGNELTVRAFDYRIEFPLNAAPAGVWEALTSNINDWWLPDFHVAAPDSHVSLNPVPGGHLVETTSDGGGLLWYTVHASTPGRSLTLVGPLCLDCGPATTMLTLSIEESDTGCTLVLADALVGHVTDKLISSLQDGWKMLMEDGLKPFVETAASAS
ncbi:MAG: hypothetical protein ABJN26_01530 [Stappiaceae bacterium]